MAGDEEPAEGVRRRRSGEHDENGRVVSSSDVDGVQIGNYNVAGNDGPIVQTSATDIPIVLRQSGIDDSDNRRTSTDAERNTSSKKRKSDEVSRLDEGKGVATLSIDIEAANAASGEKAPNTNPSRNSPLSPKSRNRGLSLRSSMFTRNMIQRSGTDESIMEMQHVSPVDHSNRPRTAKKNPLVSVAEAPEQDMFTTHVSDRVPYHVRHNHSSSKHTWASSRKGLQGLSALPNYQQWAQDQANRHLPVKRIKEAYGGVRKFVLRIRDIPPSKDGRHIPVDPSRKKPLVDDRTGHSYVNNMIKSSKYTPWNFLPRQLFAQFSKLANFYFLTISILQMIPGLSTTGTYTTIIPLMFFVSLSMAKEGYEDFRRHRLDKAENNREAKVLHAYRPVEQNLEQEPQSPGPIHWAPVKWQSLRVGDIIKLTRDEAAPADLVLLDSKGDNSVAYIETMALDGETNLKSKQPSAALVDICQTPEAITALVNTEVVVEDPNLDLYNFEGKLSINAGLSPLTNNEIIYRGSVLRNTPEAVGMVIYSGEECKIRMNANKNPRIKAPSLQTRVNKVVLLIVVFVVALSVFCTVGYQIWSAQTEKKSWYLTHARVAFGPIIVSFIIMFNTMIPLSLYVSMEIIKLAQMFLLNDIDMYDEASNTPFEARTSTINEELGQVSYIFSDKTGTLTENVMRFRKLSVAGMAWLHDADLKDQPLDEDFLLHKKRKLKSKGKRPMRRISHHSTPRASTHINRQNSDLDGEPMPRRSTATWRSTAAPDLVQEELSTFEMIRYVQRRPHTVFSRKAKMMILSMALCHTCLPEHTEENTIQYQASSPDELALVEAASQMGFIAFDRRVSVLTLKTFPNGTNSEPEFEKYEILDIIEFSSKRKRMAVVVRLPDARVVVICKGADSVIMERLRLADFARRTVTEIEKRVHQRRGREAQEALYRKSSNIERQGSIGTFPRTSMALGRSSAVRNSISRLAAIGDVGEWLDEREHGDSPRQSAQIVRSPSLHSAFDDEGIVDEAIAMDEGAVIERCFQHINDFATCGLRTLLYGHRFLAEEEYRSWKSIYNEASTSLVDRQKRIEEAGELIERDLELGGATAIEDKLQSGVPETIERLRRANIKMWMLTGDKRETAINIGQSCRLIKDYSSVTILDYESGDVEHTIAKTIIDINRGDVAHAVLIVDGRTLGMLQAEESLHSLFLDLAILVDSVVCCRASPSQKASLVHSIRRRVARSVTLAIGDGANDIAMIQEAHVGIGITGKEGLQAARVSDYSIAQFRFLTKLLLVHGHWNYVRTCKYVLGTFWKEMLFFLTQALYQRWNGYTGTSLYEQWSLSQFNTLFTSLPVIFLGVFEKDLAASTLIAVPEIYMKGQRSQGFNFKVYLSWTFMAASEAMIIFWVMQQIFGLAAFTFGRDLFSMGELTYFAAIIVINCKLQLLEQRNRTIAAFLCLFIEIGGYVLWMSIFSAIYGDNNEYDVRGGFLTRFGTNALWWLTLILAVASCLLFEVTVRTVKNALFPTDIEIFQELEKDTNVRRRLEEAAASELQAGWHHGKKKGSLELQREAEAQAEREGEVQDLLNRPRDLESGCKSGVVETEEQVVMVEDGPIRRSTDIQEMLSRRFGSVRHESLHVN